MSPSPERVFDGDGLRAVLVPGPGRALFVTFDFRKDGREGFGAPPKSGRLAARGWDHLHIQTARNDWFLNAETPALEQAIRRCARGYGRLHALGYSMGAFGALRLVGGIGGAVVTAVSPLVSILPEVAPWEDRYAVDRAFWRTAGDAGALNGDAGLHGTMVFDPQISADGLHVAALGRLYPRLRQIALPGGGHPASRALREAGDNDSPLALALGEDADGTRLVAAHARLGHSALDGPGESP